MPADPRVAYLWRDEFGDSFEGRRALVTGGTGFIGWVLGEALIALGTEVWALARGAREGAVPAGAEAMAVDLTDPGRTRQAVRDARPELVFHMASTVDSSRALEMVLRTLKDSLMSSVVLYSGLLQEGSRARVVAASSSEAVVAEKRGAAPSPYALAKRCAAEYAAFFRCSYGLDLVEARLHMTYGPGQREEKVVAHAVNSLLAGVEPDIRCPERAADFVYVGDAVRGILSAALLPGDAGAGTCTTVDVRTGRLTRIRDMVDAVRAVVAGSPPAPESIPAAEEELDAYVPSAVGCAGSAAFEAHWSLEEGLAATVDWYRKQVRGTS